MKTKDKSNTHMDEYLGDCLENKAQEIETNASQCFDEALDLLAINYPKKDLKTMVSIIRTILLKIPEDLKEAISEDEYFKGKMVEPDPITIEANWHLNSLLNCCKYLWDTNQLDSDFRTWSTPESIKHLGMIFTLIGLIKQQADHYVESSILNTCAANLQVKNKVKH